MSAIDNELARVYAELGIYKRRYEYVRALTPTQFDTIWHRNISGCGSFDSIIDKLSSPIEDKQPENSKTKLYEIECERLDIAVDEFASDMKQKLHKKAGQGFSGWADHGMNHGIRTSMITTAARLFAGDDVQAIDVANYAMMLSYQLRRI